MNAGDTRAANFARKAAEGGFASQDFLSLSGMMCWEAVKYCALKADIINEAKYARLNTKAENPKLISTDDTKVVGPGDMLKVEPGSVLGFFDPDDDSRLAHAMLSLGLGKAAGNKNDCVFYGAKGVGWEVLDLVGGLRWAQDGSVIAPNTNPVTRSSERKLWIHRRLISYLEYK